MKKGLLALLAGVAAVAGCGASGGHGSGAGAAVAPVSSSNQAPLTGPPVVTITQPARGAFLPKGPVQVTGNAVGNGIVSLTVQGNNVTLDPSGNFTTTVTLDEGVDAISVLAIDKAGNRTTRTVSVETGDYRPAPGMVPGSLAGRINASGLALMQQIAATEIASLASSIGASLQAANPIFSGYTVDVSISSLSFGTPVLALDSSTAGLTIDVTIPNVAITVTVTDQLGFSITTGTITADAVTIAMTAQLGATSNLQLQVTFPSVNIGFQNFNMALGSWLSWLGPIATPIVQPILENQVDSMIKSQAPPAIAKLVDQALTLSLGGTTATFDYAIESISTDADGIAFTVGIDLALTPDPSYPVPPGSLDTQGGLPASFSLLPTAVFSISEPALNRILQQAWQSGMLATTVNPGSLAKSFGTALPIGSTAQDLVSFLPQLQGVIPTAQLSCPIVYKIRSLLPPTAKIVSGVKDPLRLRFGEYEVTASIDTGGGQSTDVFTVSMFAEIQLGFAIQNGTLVPDMSTLKNPIVASDLVSSPLVPLGAAYIESYLDAVISMLMGGIVANIPPLPLPSLPANTQLAGATIHADGTSGTYLTIEMEIK